MFIYYELRIIHSTRSTHCLPNTTKVIYIMGHYQRCIYQRNAVLFLEGNLKGNILPLEVTIINKKEYQTSELGPMVMSVPLNEVFIVLHIVFVVHVQDPICQVCLIDMIYVFEREQVRAPKYGLLDTVHRDTFENTT